MPIALDRSELCPFWLRSDADKPEAERPTFLFYYLTRKEVRDVRTIVKQSGEAATSEECEVLIDKAIHVGLAGWKNMRNRDGNEIPYAPDALDSVVGWADKVELAVGYTIAVDSIDAEKKRASVSPSSLATAESVPDAALESATTLPPNNNP